MGSSLSSQEIVKATLTRLDGFGEGLETLEVMWNPASYRLRRAAGFHVDTGPAASGAEQFFTELFVDTTGEEGAARNARRLAENLQHWMEPLPQTLLPPRVLFLWGVFRFAGFLEELNEEWIRFDPDGTPVRGRLRLTFRRSE